MADQQDVFTGIPEDAVDDPAYQQMIDDVFERELVQQEGERSIPSPGSERSTGYQDESGKLYVGKEFTLEQFREWFKVQRLGGLPFNAVGYHHTHVPDVRQWAGMSTLTGIYNYYSGLGWQPWGKGPHLWVYSGEGTYRPGTPLVYVGTHPAHDGYGIIGFNRRWLHIEHIWNGDARPFSEAMLRASREVLRVVCARHQFADREIPVKLVRGGIDNPAQPYGVMFHRDQNPSWTPGAWPKSCPGLLVAHHQVLAEGTDVPPCPPMAPPAFDGSDKTENNVVFHADEQTVETAIDGLRCRRFANPSACEVREPLKKGEKFSVVYWVEGDEVDGESRWWVTKFGTRIWVGGTVQKPRAGPSGPIDDQTVVVEVQPRITRDRFAEILRQAESPATGEAAASWDAIVAEGVDPLFALAIFRHESRFGHEGICPTYGTRSPGNTRSSRIGVGEVLQTERGPFVRYPSWTDGWRDLAHRIVDPHYAYAQEGRRTIRQIIERWAPPTDQGNLTEAYVAAVVRSLHEWTDSGGNRAVDQEPAGFMASVE